MECAPQVLGRGNKGSVCRSRYFMTIAQNIRAIITSVWVSWLSSSDELHLHHFVNQDSGDYELYPVFTKDPFGALPWPQGRRLQPAQSAS
jgi:hypothetical protein